MLLLSTNLLQLCLVLYRRTFLISHQHMRHTATPWRVCSGFCAASSRRTMSYWCWAKQVEVTIFWLLEGIYYTITFITFHLNFVYIINFHFISFMFLPPWPEFMSFWKIRNPRWSHGWCGSTFRFMWILCRQEELLFVFRCFFSPVSRWSGRIAVSDGLEGPCFFFSNSERWTAWAIPDIWQNPKARCRGLLKWIWFDAS